ncbi:MAG: hypothetical protein WCP85_14015 [Mariniphaga sp.]
MKQSFPGIKTSIELWKGQEIVDFQEELRIKVNAQISEKWFYTHFKSSNTVLPRIDILNFLSKYVGYANWDDFVLKNEVREAPKRINVNSNRLIFLIPLFSIIVSCLLFGLFKVLNTQDYCFTFIDADTREPITNNKTEVMLLLDGESPNHHLVDDQGRLYLSTDKSKIKLVVKSPYYKTDTIIRIVKKLNHDEVVLLEPDDYALMIQYFSMMKVDDWEKRRNKLNDMIDDGAMICQVLIDKEASGVALYNKQEFIDKLTFPSGSLKNIDVLKTQLKDGKIMVLRFRIKTEKK